MSLDYGQTGYKIGLRNISAANLTSCSLTNTEEVGGFGKWTFSMNNVACGSTGFNLIIDDNTIPFVWTKIAWKTWIGFPSSCWDFSNSNGQYGNGNHNILGWSPSSGDVISKPVNSFELSQYAVKMQACDNNADNFNHGSYATGSYRHWNMVRRRNGTSAAGPGIGFACTSGGTCYVSEIIVWS